jgi:hypothetical protein
MYRENAATYGYYDLKETNDGILKLDDSFFLFGMERGER